MRTKTNSHWFWLVTLLVLVIGLIPAVAVFADDSGSGEFFGTIQSMPASGFVGDWKVNAKIVHVFNTTIIKQEDGAATVGAFVEVKGTPQSDGSFNATVIEVKSAANGANFAKFIGTVKSLPASPFVGDWVVTKQISPTVSITVHVIAATKIESENNLTPQVGSTVKVQGVVQNDGTVTAGEIEVEKTPPQTGNSVEFLGTVQTLPISGTVIVLVGDWTVSGKTIHVSTQTKIEQERARAAVGAFVKIQGLAQSDGSINAQEIEVRAAPPPTAGQIFVKFVGIVNVRGTGLADWNVAGFVVHVSASTQIDQQQGAITTGTRVEVKGLLQPDGSINALKIESEASQGSSKPKSSVFGSASAFTRTSK